MDTNKQQTSNRILALVRAFIITLIALASLTISGVAVAQATPVATFVGSGTAAEGNWQGNYGSDGYSIANGLHNLPSYATFAPLNQSDWTWASSTGDLRALQTGGGSGRLATAWYSPS